MERIADEVVERYGEVGIAMVHRTGRVELGEPSVAVVIAAARFIPGVCCVFGSSSHTRTTRTPSNFHRGCSMTVRFSAREGHPPGTVGDYRRRMSGTMVMRAPR